MTGRSARSTVALAGLAMTLAVAASAAQQPARPRGPARDTAAPVTGTSVIRGRVVDAETGMPVRRAIVRVSAESLPDGRVVTTDPEGRYEVRELPAGRYTLQASKGTYVTVSYGQRRPNERGTLVDLAAGQAVDRIDFNLPRGAVISGRIYDEFGEPMTNARVQAMRYRFVAGERRLVGAGRTIATDDRGEFRLFGLPPGEYLLSADVPRFENGGDDRSNYAPTYYPGTPSPAAAERLRLSVGQEATASFALMLVPTVSVRGLAMSSAGRPLTTGFVTLEPEDAQAGVRMMGGGGRIEPDGTFRIRNVPPGSYTLEARSTNDDDEAAEFASVPLTVAGEDVSGLVLRTTPGSAASGRIVFEPPLPPGVSAQGLRVTAPSTTRTVRGRGSRSRVRDDLTFELSGLSGERLIRVDGGPSGWYLKAVVLSGRDITDTPIDFSRGDRLDGLRIVLTERVAGLNGTVGDGAGRAVREYAVVVFAEDSARWQAPSRFVAAGRPNQDGRFEILGLPPGRYLAVAVDYLETGEEQDPAFLQHMQSAGTSVMLGDGASSSIALRLVTRSY
jgi:protocatechuate 3,4-dioxygenase beta subunit